MKVEEKYQCPACEETHDTYLEARHCCDPITVFSCGFCHSRHREKSIAEACCVQVLAPKVVAALRCGLCGTAGLTAEDVRDSQMLGTLLRCRPCILAVAPELLTAETIATGRAL
jgi:hypothetical protein